MRISDWSSDVCSSDLDDLDQISVGSPPCPLTVKPVSSEEAYAKVLQAAGAFPRDSFDTRIVSEVKARDGHIKKQAGTIDIQKNSEPPYPDAAGEDRKSAVEGKRV